jgi:hypothetical protein
MQSQSQSRNTPPDINQGVTDLDVITRQPQQPAVAKPQGKQLMQPTERDQLIDELNALAGRENTFGSPQEVENAVRTGKIKPPPGSNRIRVIVDGKPGWWVVD